MIDDRQQQAGWGAAVIPRLSRELRNDLPEVKGFSERNIGRMIAFVRACPDPALFLPQAVAKSSATNDSLLWLIPWGHHALLLEKIKELPQRLWYPFRVL
jgi:hypothetical protein